MSGIEPNLIYEMEPANSKVGTNSLESNVKVQVPSCHESVFSTGNCQNSMIQSDNSTHQLSTPKQTRTENLVPNGCLKHKLGENGLIKHSSVLEQIHVCSNDTSERNYVDGLDSSSLPNVENLSLIEKSKPEDDETDKRVAKVDCGSSRISLVDGDFQNGIEYVVYESELQMPDIMRLITKDLSEPYSIYTYRYFIHNWPKLCFLAMSSGQCVGAIVCKLDMHKKMVRRGYIAMLAIDSEFRRKKIGSHLVLKAIKAMIADDCDEVVLETEITNKAALRLYENLGFVRDKRLFRYYLNGVDALRLKLWLR